MNPQRIVRLKAENVKRLKAVEITPEGEIVVIGGKNGAGKTSVLDSICYALGGKSVQPVKPVRNGEKKAVIVCEMDDLIVTRTITETGGGMLKVTNKEGLQYTSPQAILDELCGRLTFDPLEFLRMHAKDQLNTLKVLCGLDLSDLEEKRKELYELRTGTNRQIKTLEGSLASLPEYKGLPAAPVSIRELMDELKAAQHKNQENQKARQQVAILKQDRARKAGEKIRLEAEILKMQEALNQTTRDLERMDWEAQKAETAAELLTDVDTEAIQARIEGAGETNQRIQANQRRAQTAGQLKGFQDESVKLTEQITSVDEEKKARLQAARMPIAGLSLDEGGITYNGIPFEQSSSAEQLRVSVAMGIAMNPTLRVMLIRDGSLLDDGNLRMIAEMAKEGGHQIWIERVGEGEECQVIIEEGEIAYREKEAAHEDAA